MVLTKKLNTEGKVHMFINDDNTRKFESSEKFLLGCQALGGKPVAEIYCFRKEIDK